MEDCTSVEIVLGMLTEQAHALLKNENLSHKS